MTDLIERLRSAADAYPEDVFGKTTDEDRRAHGDVVQRAAATMGRHMAPLLREAAAALEAAREDADKCAASLPGPCYMDPPDGGDVPVHEQLRRMGEDAARYQWLRQKVSAHGVIDGWTFAFPTHLTLPAPASAMRDPAGGLDTAIDQARGKENSNG